MKMKRLSAFFGLLALAGVSARADIAYTDPASQGTQGWPGNLALNFNVLSPITVTELGVFNASGSGTITGTIQVVIFDTNTNTEVTPVVTFGPNQTYSTAGLGFDVFQAITPVVLGVGSYEVDAVGFGSSDLNGNLFTGSSSGPILNNFAGSLAFTGASFDGSPVLDDPSPSSCPGCSPSQFDAGTFGNGTVVTNTPEPGTMTLLGSGLIGLTVAFRRLASR